MKSRIPDPHRRDLRESLRRDTRRHARREIGHRSFWQSLGLLGMIGWPIVLAAVGGIFLGRYLDTLWASGVRYTLMLMMAGLLIGCYTAWRTVTQHHG